MGFSRESLHNWGNGWNSWGTRCTTGECPGNSGERTVNLRENPGISGEATGTMRENSGNLREHAGSRGRVPSLRRGLKLTMFAVKTPEAGTILASEGSRNDASYLRFDLPPILHEVPVSWPTRPLIFSGCCCERRHENKKRIQTLTIFCFLIRGFWRTKNGYLD